MHFPYGFCYRTYRYMQQESNSVLVKLHPITFYRIYGGCSVPGLNATFCFLWFTNCVLLSDDNSLIPGCLWLLAFILNNILILGIWSSTIPHLPGCFYPWTFFQNIGFNMVPSDPFMLHLATQRLQGSFTLCNWFWCHGLTTCLLHVGPPFGNRFLNNSWAVGLT